MSRYIDFDYVKSKKRLDLKSMHHSVWMQDIYSAPSIDLVRCAECKKVREDGGHANCGGYLYCRKWKTLVDEDCFCSWGERSE